MDMDVTMCTRCHELCICIYGLVGRDGCIRRFVQETSNGCKCYGTEFNLIGWNIDHGVLVIVDEKRH